jgi:HAD superfamily hydrolase (TIGR01509 family)
VSPPQRQARAVLFDLDGVLVDSEPVWYAVENALVERLGGSWGHEHQAACIGGTLDATCRYIIELTGTTRAALELREELLGEMVERFRTDLPVHAGALELVDAVRERGVPTALVSSSFRLLVDAALAGLGAERFDVTVAGDEVVHGKPDPEPYRVACERLDVPPGRAVVIEDSRSGVRSAEAAGCCVVAVPSVAPIVATPTRPVVAAVRDINAEWLLGLPCS